MEDSFLSQEEDEADLLFIDLQNYLTLGQL